jgi:hypothetical protein
VEIDGDRREAGVMHGGEQLRGRRASLGHKESSCGVVVVWGQPRRAVHGEAERRRGSSWPELWKVRLECVGTKLDGL